jgi:hypothetical protein
MPSALVDCTLNFGGSLYAVIAIHSWIVAKEIDDAISGCSDLRSVKRTTALCLHKNKTCVDIAILVEHFLNLVNVGNQGTVHDYRYRIETRIAPFSDNERRRIYRSAKMSADS